MVGGDRRGVHDHVGVPKRNIIVFERYASDFSEGKPCYRAVSLTLKEEMMRHVLYALENRSRLDYEDFRRRFDADFQEHFGVELRILSRWEKVRADAAGFAFLPVRGPERDAVLRALGCR